MQQISNILRITIILSICFYNVKAFTVNECRDTSDGFKCYNNGVCIQVKLNSTSSMKLCNCAPGFTGRQCTQMETPCSPDPCGINGYCNPILDHYGYENYSDKQYICRCKPGFRGVNCEENINECLNATCHNGGLCIDGVNSYECECKWPYTGRYCQTKMSCRTNNICQNNGVCLETVSKYFGKKIIKCECQAGFEGPDCSIKVNKCLNRPCLNNGDCVPLINDYQCHCSGGFQGKNCDRIDQCFYKPCENNATCINLDSYVNHEKTYYCQCTPGYTGVNCDIKLQCLSESCNPIKLNQMEKNQLKIESKTISPSSLSPVPFEELSNHNSNSHNKNGSFVLVVNIAPSEFQQRKNEIVSEFENKLGVLMLVNKDINGQEMVYSFTPDKSSKKMVWTKVYFIIIFACIYDSDQVEKNKITESLLPSKMCLQNKVNDLNDNDEILNELQKNSNLLPEYVSNITYEAYTSGHEIKDTSETERPGVHTRSDSNLTTVLIACLAISLLVAISLAFTVLIRQNAKKVKAPVWFPPPAPGNENCDYETIKPAKKSTKAFDDFSNYFFPDKQGLQESPNSDSNSFDSKVKMRKIDMQSNPVMIYNNTPDSPECYPSPPESLPGDHALSQNPINLKGGSYSITPLMVFIMGRSKMQNSQNASSQSLKCDVNDSVVVETFINSGADLNSQNLDGETALHLAVRCGLYNICEHLIQHGAELNVSDNYGRNVLHTACGSNQYDIVKLILEYCSQQLNLSTNLVLDEKYDIIDSKTNDELGDTPLTIVSRLNFNEIISLLIEYNVSVNATDNEGRSALHWCSKVNNVNGAYLLIQAGANVNMQDNDEKTPLNSALNELNTRECADLLIKCEAFVCPEDEMKYNKMKQIAATVGLTNNSAVISNDMIAKLKQDNLNTTNYLTSKKSNMDKNLVKSKPVHVSSSTKRKLSDTFTSNENSRRSDEAFQQVKRVPATNNSGLNAYTPLTPSPPLPQSKYNYYQHQQQFNYSMPALYQNHKYEPFRYENGESNLGYSSDTRNYNNGFQQQGYSYYSEGYAAYF